MRKLYRILTFFWIVTVTVLSLVSFNNNVFSSPKNTDKVVHFTFYFIFTFLLTNCFNKVNKKIYILIIALTVSYGIIIEILQGTLTETRQADFFDVVANTAGVIAFILLNIFVLDRNSKRKFTI